MSGYTDQRTGYIFKYLITHPIYVKYVEKGFFPTAVDKVFTRVSNHYETYGTMPTEATALELCRPDIEAELYDEGLVHVLFSADISDIDPKWLEDHVQDWIRQQRLYIRLKKANDLFKDRTIDKADVSGHYEDSVTEIADIVNSSKDIDFNFQPGLDFFDPNSHIQERSDKLASPYAYLNRVTQGGYDNKTLNVYLGASNVGKCFTGDTHIRIRHDLTGEVFETTAEEFYRMLKESEITEIV